jgi:glycosyltransferase involved in cell wall biosynthesis
MYQDQKISLIIPCFDEEQGISHILRDIPLLIDEVIVIDNGSRDRTAQVAESLGARVIFESRRGYGQAYLTGFAAATGDIIVTLDGDNSYPITAVPDLVTHMIDRELDFISCCRFPLERKGSMPMLNRIGNRLLTLCFNLTAGTQLQDSQSGMWIFRRDILQGISLMHPGMCFSEEIKMEVILSGKYRFAEFPILYNERLGRAKLRRWRDGAQNLLFLFQKRLSIALRRRG